MPGPVLVATHVSKTADHVVEQAARYAAVLGAELHAVSVVPDLAVGASVAGAGADAISRKVDGLRAECTEALTRATVIGTSAGVVVREHLVQGDPAVRIATVADDVDAGLIVVGSRGLDAAGRYVLGSIPERLLFDPHGHDVLVVRTT